MKRLDLVGQRVGRLVVTGLAPRRPKSSSLYWRCLCDCGAITEVIGTSLKGWHTQSCGCKRDDRHKAMSAISKRGTKEYRVWQAMLNRCRNENVACYGDYGGRGISVDPRWMAFDAFFSDMGTAPDGFTIERIDTNGNYEPGNCKWASRHEQMRNTRRTKFYTLNGVTKCLADWAIELGVNHASLRYRIDNWDLEAALTTPKRSI